MKIVSHDVLMYLHRLGMHRACKTYNKNVVILSENSLNGNNFDLRPYSL